MSKEKARAIESTFSLIYNNDKKIKRIILWVDGGKL